MVLTSGVLRGVVWGFKPPTKFRGFAKAEPISQFHGIYIHNNLIRIWVSFICKLSEPLTRGLLSPDPRSLYPQLNLLTPPPQEKFLGTPPVLTLYNL
jgi:hypothetical protein